MQDLNLNYQLEKEDYFDWIHWNVGRQNMKKMKIITAVIYVAFLVLYLGSSIAAKRDAASLLGTVVMVAFLGAFMFYIVSPLHQERVIWKRSGLKKLERTTGFPKVRMAIREDGITMEVPGQVCKEYSYTDIYELEETVRLFLLGTSDKTWQFIAKSAFEGQESMDEFKAFLQEKIEDAKVNPGKYRKAVPAEELSEAEVSDDKTGECSETHSSGSFTADEEVIEPVDTSNMGKIGKMAHIMAALAAEDAETAAEDAEAAEEMAEAPEDMADGDTVSKEE